MDDGKKEQAKALWLQRVAIAEIARRLGMSRKQIQRWKSDGNWEAHKLPQPERPKVVSFDRPRGEAAPAKERPTIPEGDYSTLGGLLLVLDEAITMARVELAAPTIPQNFGAAVSGLCKLLEQRQKLAPASDTALIELLLQRGVSPRELLRQLREAGWLNQA